MGFNLKLNPVSVSLLSGGDFYFIFFSWKSTLCHRGRPETTKKNKNKKKISMCQVPVCWVQEVEYVPKVFERSDASTCIPSYSPVLYQQAQSSLLASSLSISKVWSWDWVLSFGYSGTQALIQPQDPVRYVK
ncbi:hypothetical protein KQX54_000630 [Cotesia glomerata]|uniref:Uncharacterized protein n=1 Tax=Cotesia glomerata TaxID=32391 RepID=A0AAV7I338_COTGL|nr:hypothetical protein KQX54_000630 [Cotesia glomerata]